MAATIQASFGIDNTPFLRGMEVAERRAQATGRKIQQSLEGGFSDKAGHFVEKTFRKHGSAQVALAQLGQNIIAGDLEGALQGITLHMAGLGLAAGAGVAVAAEAFISLKQHLDETEAAETALREDMAQPLELISNAGEADTAIANISKNLDDLQAKSSNWQSTFSRAWLETWAGFANADRAATARQQEQNAAFAEAQQLARDSGATALQHAQNTTNPGEMSALAENALKFEQEKAKLELAARNNPALAAGLRDQEKALEMRREFSADEIADREEGAKREFASSKAMIAMRKDGVDEETQKRVQALMQARDLEQDLQSRTLTPDQRRKMELERANDLLLGAPAQSNIPGFGGTHFGTAGRADWERQFGFGGFTKRHIEDALGAGGVAASSLASDQYQTPEEALLGTGSATAQEIAGYRKNFGGLPGEAGANQALTRADLDAVMQKYWGKN